MITQGPKAEDIQSIFTSVAHGYDAANDAMTLGMARLWRKQLVRWSEAKPGAKVLDCATGTGDLAIEFKKAVGPTGQVIGTDFCASMLDKAPAKAKRSNLDVQFQLADVMQLPFEAQQFDVCSIAYGVRNVSDPILALKEMARVVRPGGHVMILETGDSPDSYMKVFFDFYIRQMVPRIGGMITGQRQAYEYLNQSSRGFPSRERFLELVSAADAFSKSEFRVLFGGASFLYKATVR
jgi:demethylmenaquinone methyltransferase/2-methoxy-6-polyprenyl-1,4-benzoquinol methylase